MEQEQYTEKLPASAEWIWLPGEQPVNQYADFRCLFDAEKKGRVTLYISADFGYEAFVNGRRIDAFQFPDFPNQKVVDRLDVTGLVEQGTNLLAVKAYRQGEDGSIHRLSENGLFFALFEEETLLVSSGTSVLCRPALDYASGEMERFSPQLSFAFRCDLTARDGFEQPSYRCGAEWQNAALTKRHPVLCERPIAMPVIGPTCGGILRAQGVFRDACKDAPMGQRMFRAALSARHPQDFGLPPEQPCLPASQGLTMQADAGDGLYLLVDLLRETSGLVSLDFSCEEPCEVLVGFGEHLEDLRIRTDMGPRQFAFRLCAKAGRQQFSHPFKRLGCRFLQLHFCTRGRVTLFEAGLRPSAYPVVYLPEFGCADHLHNRIFSVSRRTLELCMHEHYEDCPWREQALYAMDARSQMLCGYYVFAGRDFAAASLRLLAAGQREDGLLDLVAPARGTITIPAFSLNFVIAVYEHLLFGGSVETVRSLLPAVLRIMEVFEAYQEEDGTVSRLTEPRYWNFYEWNPGLDGDRIFRTESVTRRAEAPLTAFYVLALQAVQQIFQALNEPENALPFQEKEERAKEGLQHFWREEAGAFASFAGEEPPRFDKLTQSLILLTGVCTDAQKDLLLPKLADRESSLTDVTLSCRLFLYQALMLRPEMYGRTVAEDIARIWGNMLFSGATSFWETVKGADDFEQAGSLCHGWSAVPIWFYYHCVLGVRPGSDSRLPVPCGIPEPILLEKKER